MRVWDASTQRCLFTMGSHTMVVTCVRWGGEGLIYSSSRDTSINVWDARDGKLVRTLKGHGHYVNTLALSSEAVLRSGAYDHTGRAPADAAEAMQVRAWHRIIACMHACMRMQHVCSSMRTSAVCVQALSFTLLELPTCSAHVHACNTDSASPAPAVRPACLALLRWRSSATTPSPRGNRSGWSAALTTTPCSCGRRPPARRTSRA